MVKSTMTIVFANQQRLHAECNGGQVIFGIGISNMEDLYKAESTQLTGSEEDLWVWFGTSCETNIKLGTVLEVVIAA